MNSPKLLIGMCGSIGVLNMPAYLPLLRAKYPALRVILTQSALRFITKNALSLLTSEVYSDLFPEPCKIERTHAWLAQWADLLIVLPATAHLLAQAAHGLADSLLSVTILAHTKRVVFFPNMNAAMWHRPSTQRNVSLLQQDGHLIATAQQRDSFTLLSTAIRKELTMPSPEEVISIIDAELQQRQDAQPAGSPVHHE